MLKVYPHSFTDEFINQFNEEFKDYTCDVLNEADHFVEGKVNVFGIECDLASLLEDVDPTTGAKWPRKHYKEYWFHAGAAPGDVKFTWEYMKHYFLVAAGKAYLLTKNEKYLKKSKEFIENWLAKTDDWLGVSWVGHVHICQRMFSWFSWLDMTKGSELLDEKFYLRVNEYFKKQEKLLSEEYENPRNNHKLVSIVTIILCHLHFDKMADSEVWFKRLEETVKRLIYKDGGFTEQSVSYHRLCIEALIVLGLALENEGLTVPDFILTAIERSLEYFAALTTPEGKLPIIGDNSNEILISRPTDFWETEYLFQLAAPMGITIRSFHMIDPDAYFYLGSFEEVDEPFTNLRSFAFPITGHYVIKESKDYAFLKAGEFGMYMPDSRSGHPHSHLDQLGVVLHLGGMEVLTDPGTYRYNENDFERRIMKDESFHSTFLVDDSHQGVYTSSFSYADAIDGSGRIEEDSLVGEITVGGVKAIRRVSLSQGACLLHDAYEVLDKTEHTLQSFFCLSPRFTVVKYDDKRVVLQHIGTMRYLSIEHSTGVTPRIYPGYVSREYNRSRPNQRIVFKMPLKDSKNLEFYFHYVPNKD